jgi:hypothetical protein
MRFVRVSQELIPIRPLVQNPNLDRSEVQVAPTGLELQSLGLTQTLQPGFALGLNGPV